MRFKLIITFLFLIGLISLIAYRVNQQEKTTVNILSTNHTILPKEKLLSDEQQKGKELFKENCRVCHKSNICGPRILEYAFKDYDELGISWRKFLQGDWSNLIYLEEYKGISCKPADPPFEEIQIDQLLSYLNYIKGHNVPY